jgi:sec-independent protein translocase protein TatC
MSQHNLLRFLLELRRRIIFSLLALAVIFAVLSCFMNAIYTDLALPLLKHLPYGQGLIATDVVAPFMVPMKLTLVLAAFLGVPVFLYQVWAFIAPALYQHEKHFIWPLLFISTILFYLGIGFAYFVVLPLLLKFFAASTPTGVALMPDMERYLDFTLKLFFSFGTIFEVPILTIILVWTGIVTRERLISLRSYVIVGAFVVGMLLGPPDVLSQTMLAVPLWLLFEVGIVLAAFFVPATNPIKE